MPELHTSVKMGEVLEAGSTLVEGAEVCPLEMLYSMP